MGTFSAICSVYLRLQIRWRISSVYAEGRVLSKSPLVDLRLPLSWQSNPGVWYKYIFGVLTRTQQSRYA